MSIVCLVRFDFVFISKVNNDGDTAESINILTMTLFKICIYY